MLFLFGFANAGIEFSLIGAPTWLVFFGLLIGNPLGIALFGRVAAYPMRPGLPTGMRLSDLFVLGCVAAIGFTVSLFVASVAFPPETMLGDIRVLDAATMGALMSIAAAVVAIVVGRIVGVTRQHD